MLTLSETAELLGVHYMTAYRYVRIGKLPARKEGQVWKIDRADVEPLIAGKNSQSSSSPVRVDWASRTYNRMTTFDEQGAWLTIEAALASGLDPAEAYTTILVPALEHLGEEWQAGRISIAEEHAATSVCQRLVGRLGFRTARRGVSKGTVVFGCPENEQHKLATTIASDIFRTHGYDVVNCGTGLPPDSFASLAASTARLVGVGISSTAVNNEAAIANMIATTRHHLPGATILLGGRAVDSLASAAELGADFSVASAQEGVAKLAEDSADS